MVPQYNTIQKRSSKNFSWKQKHGKTFDSHDELHQDQAEAQEASKLAAKISQVDQFLSTLEPQDLEVLKQRILINQKTGQADEGSSVWEKQLAMLNNEQWTLREKDSAQLSRGTNAWQYPVALYTWDDWLEKVRETLLSHGFNPDTIVAMLLDWATNAMMPTFDWWLIEDHKTRFSYINKAIKLLGWEKKEPVTIRIEPLTQPKHFI